MKYLKWIILCLFLPFYVPSEAQITLHPDSVQMNIDRAEQLFINENLSLLAGRYQIEAAKALEIQAKLFPNPNLQIGQMAYNSVTKGFFPFGKNGDFGAQLSQLFLLAGKRNKSLKIAQSNSRLSELQFQDLVRTLKYVLHSDFYKLYFKQQSAKYYTEEISSLQTIVDAFGQQAGMGNISEKEYVRIRAQILSLKSEYSDLINDMNDTQSELRLLLHISEKNIVPELPDRTLAGLIPQKYPLQTLLDSAYVNRTDLLITKENTNNTVLNQNYQKALAVPDLTAILGYEQNGGAVRHQVQLGVSMDLPFFNKNQGNIRNAKAMTDYAKGMEAVAEGNIQETVFRALQKAYDMDNMAKSIDPVFMSDFEKMEKEVLKNYQKRNISLLDFLDFYNSYKDNILQANDILYNKAQAFEDINFYTGTSFYNN